MDHIMRRRTRAQAKALKSSADASCLIYCLPLEVVAECCRRVNRLLIRACQFGDFARQERDKTCTVTEVNLTQRSKMLLILRIHGGACKLIHLIESFDTFRYIVSIPSESSLPSLPMCPIFFQGRKLLCVRTPSLPRLPKDEPTHFTRRADRTVAN
jgi:hypothetical protein